MENKNEIIKVLVHNSVKCLECGEVLVSKSQHHYVQCDCNNSVSCDGGLEYLKYAAKDLNKVEDLSKYVYMTKQEYNDMLENKRIKDEEILQQKIDAGLMVNFGGKYIHKTTYDIIMNNCLKLGKK